MRNKSKITVFGVVVAVLGRGVASFVQGLAFWVAVVMPLVYVSLLLLGSPALSDPSTVAEFTTLNVVSLVVGHGYGDP